MINTTARTRAKSRPKVLAPTIREVCLVGSPRRSYVHIRPEGLRAEDSGLRKTRSAETG